VTIFFTSDHHFGHTNILKYQNRPFPTIEEMNEVLIDKWNSVVKPNDTIYHLGDFALVRTKNEVDNIVRRLNGHKHLILGNHDRQPVKHASGFVEIEQYKEIAIDGIKLILFHYPIESWNGAFHETYHLHGHSHGKSSVRSRRIDVGVDVHNYYPINYEEVKQLMTLHSDS